jgi:hypothetical protein
MRAHALFVFLTLPVIIEEVHFSLQVVDHYHELNQLTTCNFDMTRVSGTLPWNTSTPVARLLARAFNPPGRCATPLGLLFKLSLVGKPELTDRSRSDYTSMMFYMRFFSSHLMDKFRL